jgi:hypothetical protein
MEFARELLRLLDERRNDRLGALISHYRHPSSLGQLRTPVWTGATRDTRPEAVIELRRSGASPIA